MRSALYFTPDSTHPLTRAVAAWLGRDPFTGESFALLPAAGFSAAETARLTAEPRRYGFHATLVAPFRLAEGVSPDTLRQAAARFAAGRTVFAMPPLRIARIGSFLALTPAMPCVALDQLASGAVEALNPLRAPLDEQEIARRNPQKLSQRQRDYLHRYGYPYVMEEFQFHMTLTGRVTPDEADRLEPALAARFAEALAAPLIVNAVALFDEPAVGAPFSVRSLHPFCAEATHG